MRYGCSKKLGLALAFLLTAANAFAGYTGPTVPSGGGGGGSGTVTSLSVNTANGLAGSVSSATTTPAITLSTTASGVLQGNGTAISGNARLDQLAAPSTDVSLNSHKITSLATPSASTDAATKAYADAIASGLLTKQSVSYACTANITGSYVGSPTFTLTEGGNGALTCDSATPLTNDRILVKNQSSGSQNGIYVVTQPGDGSHPYILTRATDFDSSGETMTGAYTFVIGGTVNAATGFILITPPTITLDTTALSFTQFSSATNYIGGAGLTLTSLTFDIGAGTGISVGADNVGVDTAVVATTTNVLTMSNKTFTAPVLGVATATSLNGLTINNTTGTLAIGNGKTLTQNATLIYGGTDGSSVSFGAGGTVAYASDNLGIFAPTTSAQLASVLSDETGTGVFARNTDPTMAGMISFSASSAVTAGNYQIGRDDTATNQLNLNAPTGAQIALGTNNTARFIIGDTAVGVVANADCTVTTTGACFALSNANALTTGNAANFKSNSADTGTRDVVMVRNQNAAAVNATALKIQQDANAPGLSIVYSGTSKSALTFPTTAQTVGVLISANSLDSLTTGGAFQFLSNSASASTRTLGLLRNQNTSATAATVLGLRQDAAAPNLVLTQTGNGIALTVNGSGVTTAQAISVTGDNLTTGSLIGLSSNSASSGTRTLATISNSNSGATGTTGFSVTQSSTGVGATFSRGAVSSANNLVSLLDAGTSSGSTLSVTKSGGGYGSLIGMVSVQRTGNYTGVTTEHGVDLRIAPAFTLTEPSSGIFAYSGQIIDLTNLAVTAGAGSSSVSALTLTAGTDADAGSNFSLRATGNVSLTTSLIIYKTQQVTVASDGTGAAATATLTPTSGNIQITCNDTDGCDITLAEPANLDGATIKISNVTANVANFADTAGVTELAGAYAMGQYDALSLTYAVDRWVENSRSNN